MIPSAHSYGGNPAFAAYRSAPVVVIGASGFIGRWVSRALSQCGAALTLIVRNHDAAQQVFADYGVAGSIIEADVTASGVVSDALQRIRPAVVFNLAGYGVDHAEKDPALFEAVNAGFLPELCSAIAGTRNPDWPGACLVHAGSALEYGTLSNDLAEDSTPEPDTIYGKSKLAGTRQIQSWSERFAMPSAVARLFTVYGPGEHETRLLPSLLRAASTGTFLPLSDGTQERDFTYVEDVAEGLLRLGLANLEPGAIVNLATGRLTSVRAFAEIAATVFGVTQRQLGFGMIPTRFREMRHKPVTIRRMRELTNWRPAVDISSGIKRTKTFLDEINSNRRIYAQTVETTKA
jgi:UDP-glucose 4-epimerase